MAAGKEHGCVLYHAEQVGQGLFADNHVQRSINEILFHWQSQSTTSDNSPTGQRYIHHKERGSKVVICVREFKNDAAGAAPYSLLGLCDFVKYEGSRPMNITWKLERAIPAKYLRKTGKLVV